MTISKIMTIQDTAIDNIIGVDYANISEIYGIKAIPPTGTFSFDITIASADTFELPINDGGSEYAQDFTVDWGDSSSSTITSYADTDRTHSYSSAGTYTVVLEGTSEWFAFEDGGDKTLVVKLNSFTGNMGFKELNFQGCNNLTTICVLGTMAYLDNASNMFENCTSLTAIPTGLFDNCSGMSDTEAFYFTFYGCTSLTAIPTDLFKYHTDLYEEAFNSTFYGCTGLTAIPADLFKYNTLVKADAFVYTFYGCTGLTAIPTDLFRYNTAMTRGAFYFTFKECTGLTSIVSDLFKYNTLISTTAFYETFRGCTGLTAIPADIFEYNTLISTKAFYETFRGCTGLTAIPADIFKYNTAVSTYAFYSTFRECTSITSIPTDLFRYNTAMTSESFRYTFYGCTALTTVSSGLFKYNTSALEFSNTFYGCSKLQLISDLFCDAGDEDTRFLNQSINFTNCFYRASFNGTIGTAPALWNYDFGTGTTTSTDCFAGDGNSTTSISNYANIDSGWL